MNRSEKTPWWLWPNLLSLDAPLVAVAWLFILATGWQSFPTMPIYFSLAGVVWLIYVFDRIIDAWKASKHQSEDRLELRHFIHYRYRGWFLLTAIFVFMAMVRMILFVMPVQMMMVTSIPILMSVAYFSILSSISFGKKAGLDRIPYKKNFVAGLTFAMGTASGGIGYTPFPESLSFLWNPMVLCFGLLCILNITAIDVWRELRKTDDPDENVLLEISLTMPLIMLAGFSLYKAAYTQHGEQLVFTALFVASSALFLLHRSRRRFTLNSLRVLSDIALLLPLPIFFLL